MDDDDQYKMAEEAEMEANWLWYADCSAWLRAHYPFVRSLNPFDDD